MKKLLALILALVLALTLVACGGSSTPSPADDSAASQPADTQSPDETAQPSDTTPEPTFTEVSVGDSFSVAIPEGVRIKETEEGIDIFGSGPWYMSLTVSDKPTPEAEADTHYGYEWETFTYGAAEGIRGVGVNSNDETLGIMLFLFYSPNAGGSVGYIELVKNGGTDGDGGINALLDDADITAILDSISAPQ
jgi:hypothetical protein